MELYFNMFKIRYLLMDELLKEIEFEDGEEINVFINIENVLKKITSTIEDKENMITGPKRNLLLTSCVFNLIAHYRNYFNKKKVCSKVYLYGPEDEDVNYVNKVYNSSFRSNSPLLNRDKTTSIGNTYKNSIKMMKTILSYVEGVYFITTGIIEPSLLPHIVVNDVDKNNKKNFMISDDRYEYQYTQQDFYILKPRLEKSILISKDNVMDVIKYKTKCTNVENPDINFLPFIISVLGDQYRNIDKIKRMGVSSIYKVINKGIDNNIINSSVSNINSLLQVIEEKNHNDVTINYLTTSINEQYKRTNSADIRYIKSQIFDKYDSGYLNELNEEYFMEFPLSVIEINRGIKRTRPRIQWR